jgi:hypothetical protein
MLSGMTGLVVLALAASPEPRLIDLAVSADARLVTRLENELRAAGFRVVRRRLDEAPSAGAHGEVQWSGSGPVLARRFTGEAGEASFEDPGDLGVWALRVVEWLRADPRRLTRSVPAAAPAAPAPPRLTFDVSAGPLVRGAPGLGVGFGLTAGAGVWFGPGFGLQVALKGPMWTTVARGEVSAMVREVAVQLRALAALAFAQRWRLVGGLGVGVRNVLAVGLTPLEFSRSAQQTGLDAAALVGLRLALSAHLFVELRAEVAATVPLIALEFAGTPVGLVNAPGLSAALALGATW